jgi:anti-sigma-K factor RskA
MDMRAPGCGDDVAPYLLGALDREDAERFERHLAGCELCQADVARLRPVIEALPATTEEVEPPRALRRRVMADVKRDAAERRRAARPARERRPAWLRPVPALAAACVLLVAGIGVGIGLSGDASRTVDGQVAIAGASAELRIDDGDGRLQVAGVPSPREDRVWQVWLVRDGGPPQPTDALFTTDHAGNASVGVPGDLDDVDRVLVSEEPRGGSRSPTTPPKIDIRLS